MGKNETGFISNLVGLMLSWTRRTEQTKYLIFIILVIGVIIRLVSIPVFVGASHNPVDVYYVDNQSAKLILDLKSPYLQEPVVHGYPYVFVYLPMVAVYYVPFYLLGDIRFGNIVADVLIMFSVYWIAKSINRGAAFFAPLAFALLPLSVLLTSIDATNIMIGTSFLTFSIAALLKKEYSVAAIFLGMALATNQLVALALPVLIYYFWDEHKFSYFLGSILFSAGITLPFFLTDPHDFINDAILFQFERPLQSNGSFSLYSMINAAVGQSVASWLRVALFLIVVLVAIIWLSRKSFFLILSIGGLLLLGAFILPINGFLNYFLPGAAFFCSLVPYVIYSITSKIQKPVS